MYHCIQYGMYFQLQENQEIAQACLSILNENQKTALETELAKPQPAQS